MKPNEKKVENRIKPSVCYSCGSLINQPSAAMIEGSAPREEDCRLKPQKTLFNKQCPNLRAMSNVCAFSEEPFRVCVPWFKIVDRDPAKLLKDVKPRGKTRSILGDLQRGSL